MTENAMAHRASQAYRTAAVAVPPLRAVVMLHNGAITFLQRAIEAQEARRFEEGHGYMMRATAILRGLSHNLDSSSGNSMAERLYKTYNALILACLRSYGRRQAKESFRRIIASLTRLRESWEFVEATAAKNAKADKEKAETAKAFLAACAARR
jgi:flagellar protein FliS